MKERRTYGREFYMEGDAAARDAAKVIVPILMDLVRPASSTGSGQALTASSPRSSSFGWNCLSERTCGTPY